MKLGTLKIKYVSADYDAINSVRNNETVKISRVGKTFVVLYRRVSNTIRNRRQTTLTSKSHEPLFRAKRPENRITAAIRWSAKGATLILKNTFKRRWKKKQNKKCFTTENVRARRVSRLVPKTGQCAKVKKRTLHILIISTIKYRHIRFKFKVIIFIPK